MERSITQHQNVGDYKQVKISVNSTVAVAFKNACAESNVSMAEVLSKFMAEFSNNVMKPKTLQDYSTKRRRRAAIKVIIRQLKLIKNGEETYRDSIPENLCGSIVYDNADEAVSMLEEVIDMLDDF